MKNTAIKSIMKGICMAAMVFAILGLVFLCYGNRELPVAETTRHATSEIASTPEVASTTEVVKDSDVKEQVTLRIDGQEKHVKCKHLLVPTSGCTVYIENDNIEVITVFGNGNTIIYPKAANPKIRDNGMYNNIEGSWL